MSKTDTIKKRKVKKRINLENYVNIETAESLDSELNKGAAIYMDVETDEVILSFDNYVCYDASFEEEICRLLKPAAYQRYKLMSCWLHTPFNVVLSGNNQPHTRQTLAKAVGLSVDETTRFIKRLASFGLLVYDYCPESGFDKKIFMLNPFVTRKRKTINIKLMEIFTDIRHAKLQPIKNNRTATKKAAQLQEGQMN